MCSALRLQTAARYANLVNGVEEVESCLRDCFAEHLNSEVGSGNARPASQVWPHPSVAHACKPAAAIINETAFSMCHREACFGTSLSL